VACALAIVVVCSRLTAVVIRRAGSIVVAGLRSRMFRGMFGGISGRVVAVIVVRIVPGRIIAARTARWRR
jgi:hypothetical protein